MERAEVEAVALVTDAIAEDEVEEISLEDVEEPDEDDDEDDPRSEAAARPPRWRGRARRDNPAGREPERALPDAPPPTPRETPMTHPPPTTRSTPSGGCSTRRVASCCSTRPSPDEGKARKKTKAQRHDDRVRFDTLCTVIWNVTGRPEPLEAIAEQELLAAP